MTLAWIAAAALALLIASTFSASRSRAVRLTRLRAEWGSLRERPRDREAISALHRAHTADGQALTLDDRTWADLNMNDVFDVLDRTESVIGQQVLYSRLRGAGVAADLDAFDALITRMSDDASAREDAQVSLGALASPAAYDLWWLAQPDALRTAPWHVLFPIVATSMFGALVLTAFWPPALFFVIAGAIGSLITRARIASDLRVVAGAFRQVGPLIATGQALSRLSNEHTAPLIGTLAADVSRLSRLKRIGSWAGRDSSAAVSGEISSAVFEYLNMIFWLDANALLFGARELRARHSELRRVISAVGHIDAAISVASYRAGTPGWTRPRFSTRDAARMTDVRHPLLPDAVPNSLLMGPPAGLIITGSNMSGKSTFLRTIGVTAVLAQTVNTCLATHFEAPAMQVRSCIGLADDPASGKSYYLVEVESVLGMVRASGSESPHLLLFDELFRGTNAIERIAAGAAVLRALVAPRESNRSPHFVLAATHDRELVDLLAGLYDPHHFPDTVDASGLSFSYRLEPGPATTRNAIAVLEQRGAPPTLVRDALTIAEALEHARRRTVTPV